MSRSRHDDNQQSRIAVHARGEMGGLPENAVLDPLHGVQFGTHANAKAEAFFSTLKGECFPESQVFDTKAQARREIFEYVETYYNNVRLHSALDYRTPSQYETKFIRVIDNAISSPQSIDAAPEDRALQGCNSSADAALQTAGVGASDLVQSLNLGPIWQASDSLSPRALGSARRPFLKFAPEP